MAGRRGPLRVLARKWLPLLLGMRASEIVSRVVRDLDDDWRLLWILDSKTEAGKCTLRVLEVLQSYAKPEAVEGARQRRAFRVLAGGIV